MSQPFDREKTYLALTSGDDGQKIDSLQRLFVEAVHTIDDELFAVVELLKKSPDPGGRFWAKKLFSRLAVNKAETEATGETVEPLGEMPVELLCKKLEHVSKSSFMAMKVILKLCESRSPQALEFLTRYLKGCEDELQVSYLVKNLGLFFPSDALLTTLCPFLSHRDERIIANAIEGIEAIGTPKSFAICSRFIKHSNNRVRANAARAIGTFDATKARQIVQRMLEAREQPQLMISGCYAARELKDRSFLPALRDLLTVDLVIEDALSAITAIDKETGVRMLRDYVDQSENRLQKIRTVIRTNSTFLEGVLGGASSPAASEGGGGDGTAAGAAARGSADDLESSTVKHDLSVFLAYVGISRRSYPFVVAGLVVLLLGLTFAWWAPWRKPADVAVGARNELAARKLDFTQQEFLRCLGKGREREAELFIKGGIDVNTRNQDQATPLHFSSYAGQARILGLLLEAKAEANAVDRSGLSALHLAANRPIADMLLKAGANPNLPDRQGRTPLHRAVESGNLEVVATLIDHGAEINRQNGEGNTPLHLAANGNQQKIVELLLAKGANARIKNRLGIAPVDLGVANGAGGGK